MFNRPVSKVLWSFRQDGTIELYLISIKFVEKWTSFSMCFCGEGELNPFKYMSSQGTFNGGERIPLSVAKALLGKAMEAGLYSVTLVCAVTPALLRSCNKEQAVNTTAEFTKASLLSCRM